MTVQRSSQNLPKPSSVADDNGPVCEHELVLSRMSSDRSQRREPVILLYRLDGNSGDEDLAQDATVGPRACFRKVPRPAVRLCWRRTFPATSQSLNSSPSGRLCLSNCFWRASSGRARCPLAQPQASIPARPGEVCTVGYVARSVAGKYARRWRVKARTNAAGPPPIIIDDSNPRRVTGRHGCGMY